MNILGHSYRRYGATAIILVVLSISLLSPFHFTDVTAATSATGVLVPLFTYPTDPSWSQLIQAKEAYPNVPVAAIINPANGPGSAQDPNFVQGINSLRSAGIIVLGYVATGYGSVSQSYIESQINDYKQWYNVNGILFDEMTNVPGYESYYSAISSYAHSLGYAWTVGNAGAPVPSSYVGTVNTIITYENAGLPTTAELASWTMGYPASEWAFTAYSVGSVTQSYVASAAAYVGWMYITNLNYPNPYTAIPSYFTTLLSYLSGITTTGGPVTMTINTVNQAGAPITGLYTIIQSSTGATLDTGYSPLSYTATAGASYTVTVYNYGSYTFSSWNTGATTASITVTPTQSTTLTAYYAAGGPVTMTINTVNQAGAPITGLYTIIQSSTGATLDTGYSPLSYTATAGASYTVTVYNYGSYTFSSWNTGATTASITVTPTQSTTLTAYYAAGGPVTMTINTVNQAGAPITGLYTIIQSSTGATLDTGYSPLSYTATAGASYTVTVYNYGSYTFSSWNTGATTASITVTPTQSTTLTAYYAAGGPVTMTINTVNQAGAPITGLYTIIQSSTGATLDTGYSPLSYTATAGASYTVTVYNYGSYTFSSWNTGATTASITVTPTQSTTLTAYYA